MNLPPPLPRSSGKPAMPTHLTAGSQELQSLITECKEAHLRFAAGRIQMCWRKKSARMARQKRAAAKLIECETTMR